MCFAPPSPPLPTYLQTANLNAPFSSERHIMYKHQITDDADWYAAKGVMAPAADFETVQFGPVPPPPHAHAHTHTPHLTN